MSEALQKKIEEIEKMPVCDETARLLDLAKRFSESGLSLADVARSLETAADFPATDHRSLITDHR